MTVTSGWRIYTCSKKFINTEIKAGESRSLPYPLVNLSKIQLIELLYKKKFVFFSKIIFFKHKDLLKFDPC